MFQNVIVQAVTLTPAIVKGYLTQNESIRAHLGDVVSEGDWEDPCVL